ncbi:hypothetical protein OLK001_02880 [Synechocystis sp. LKSZ1]
MLKFDSWFTKIDQAFWLKFMAVIADPKPFEVPILALMSDRAFFILYPQKSNDATDFSDANNNPSGYHAH